MTKPDDLLHVGFIRGAHALKGIVNVHVFSGEEETLTEYGPLYTQDGSKMFEFEVTGLKQGDFMCAIDGVNDRNAAEALKGTKLYIPASALPELDEDDFYVKDLIGLTALSTDGITLGKIKDVTNFGEHDALEITFIHTGTEELAVPQNEYILFTKQNVPELSLAAGTITVDVPHGLFEIVDKHSD